MSNTSPWYSSNAVVSNTQPVSTKYDPLKVMFKDEAQFELFREFQSKVNKFTHLVFLLGSSKSSILKSLPSKMRMIATVDLSIDIVEFDGEIPENYSRLYKTMNRNSSFQEFNFWSEKLEEDMNSLLEEAEYSISQLGLNPSSL